MRSPGIGGRQHRATLQAAVMVTDAAGGRVETWVTYDTIWASIKPMPFVVNEKDAAVLFMLGIAYRPDVEDGQRAIVNGKTLKIIAIVDPDDHHQELQLYCATATITTT